jgi:hypothetical protein
MELIPLQLEQYESVKMVSLMIQIFMKTLMATVGEVKGAGFRLMTKDRVLDEWISPKNSTEQISGIEQGERHGDVIIRTFP